jgi:hypothetical protein
MLPHERSLVKRMENKPFALIGVNGDQDAELLKKQNEVHKVTWRSFKDKQEGKPAISEEWNLFGWPTLYLIDHKGIIRQKWIGSPGDKIIDASVDELVKEAEGKQKS